MSCLCYLVKIIPSPQSITQLLSIYQNFIWVCYYSICLIVNENEFSFKWLVFIFITERIFEDHENIVEAMSNWSRDSENQIIFIEKEEKYDLFLRPEVSRIEFLLKLNTFSQDVFY